MKKILLEIVGLSYSQSQSGAYALIIGEVDGKRRLPIIIGNAEAQAIALELENYKTSRPLTHDLFHSFAKTFEIEITEVIINKFLEGIFYAILICKQNNEIAEIDSRTSDSVALALRFKCPIYTFEEILNVAGIIFEDEQVNTEDVKEIDEEIMNIFDPVKTEKEIGLSSYNENELNEMLKLAISNEEFEKASIIRDELKRRTKK